MHADGDTTRHTGRDILPTPDIPPAGLTTCDAKDPDTSFPPIEPIRPPEGAPIRPGTCQVCMEFDYDGGGLAEGGDVRWVKIELGSDAHDHVVDPEHAVRVAMSVQ